MTISPNLLNNLPKLSPTATAGCVAAGALAAFAAVEPRLRGIAEATLNAISDFFGSPQLVCATTAIPATAIFLSTNTNLQGTTLNSVNYKNSLAFMGTCGLINAIRGYIHESSDEMQRGVLATILAGLGVLGLTAIENSFKK